LLGSATPARLGRFRVLELLGSGSFATVYRAFDPDLERDVAVKVPRAGVVAAPAAASRFLGEARAMARLCHPAIVPVFEAGRAGELPYLATAYVPGRTLLRVLEAGPLRPAHAARVAADLADALAYAHGVGVVHRDVKPANVIVDEQEAVHLTDFGIAARHDPAARTPGGFVTGTPAYLAPEQIDGDGPPALPASDQYSLGVVLYEMLCGRPPFLGPPPLVLYSARFDDPLPPRSLRPGVPRGLERICLRAMSRETSARYPSCHDLAADLRRWLRGESARTGVAARSVGSAVRWLRERPGAAVSASLALIGVATSTALAASLLTPYGYGPQPAPADGPAAVHAAPPHLGGAPGQESR
jgi:serine/threonine protein kinase